MKTAETSVPVHPLLADRWSPRGFDRAHSLAPDQLAALLEAARWAPSANNSQPWRFLVAQRGAPEFDRLTAALAPGNRAWADAASALLLVAAETVDETGRPRPWALYDTGQAVAHLITQAQADGLATHQMGGFDAAAVRDDFGLAEALSPVVVIAVGRLDGDAALPEPLAARERAPRTRAPLRSLLLTPAQNTELPAA
ncbi:nitroreductase family protein [Plantactinospora siamensis]|uniref:Nitroreductase family protein n=1 Tax=Plantactinospora siamensis TaxID=555372 RepID=A0ABV6P030_9ACTN